MRQPGQPLARQGVNALGRNLPADRLQPLRVVTAEDAVVERLEADALLRQLALDVFMAVDAELGVVREIRAELEEERAEVVIDGIEVVGVGQGGGEGQRGEAAAGGGIDLRLGAQHAGLFLRLADVQHALAAGPVPEVRLGALVLALAFLEADQVDVAVPGEGLDRGHELASDGSHQGRRGHRVAADVAEEVGGTARSLQQRLIEIEVETVDALDLQADVVGEGFGDVACYSHGAGSGRWAPHRAVTLRTLSQSRPYGGPGRRAEQRLEPALSSGNARAASTRTLSV